jgi:hypothetical protein
MKKTGENIGYNTTGQKKFENSLLFAFFLGFTFPILTSPFDSQFSNSLHFLQARQRCKKIIHQGSYQQNLPPGGKKTGRR